MSTIMRDRAEQSRNPNEDILTNMVRFAAAERELQRQECAEAVRLWLIGDDVGIEMGAWFDELRTAILAAGTEPTNPFGCGCGWAISKDGYNWWLRHLEVYHNSMSTDYCQKCGAKRRET